MRECSRCHQSFPATTQYFVKHPKCRLGISYQCLPCARLASKLRNDAKREEIRAHCLTPEYRAHRRAYNARRREIFKAQRKARDAKRIVKMPTQKRCSKCHMTKSYTEFWKSSSTSTGLMCACKACQKAYEKANRYKYKATHEASWRNHRARRNGAKTGDKITLIALAIRDQWRCHLCHRRVTKRTWSCDHLIPLSHGGTESWQNVALAHNLCNNVRNAGRTAAQLLMFGDFMMPSRVQPLRD